MAMFDNFKVRAAMAKHQKGDTVEAMRMYEQLYRDGCLKAVYLLPYTVLLLRRGQEEDYPKVKEILVKTQKAPDLTPERRQQLMMNYAVVAWKTGELEKGIRLLEGIHRENKSSLIYQSLGYLYIEAGDAQKALEYNLEALEYDDEDSITLDNLGQIYYRMLDDKEKAKPYFVKAHEIKPDQIDTLYFLSRYALEENSPEKALEYLNKTLEGRFSPMNYASYEKVNAEIRRIREENPGLEKEQD